MSSTTLSHRSGTFVESLVRPSVTADVLISLVGAAFIGLLAQISWMVSPFVVPFTGQTLAILVVGGTFGLRRGLTAVALYVVAGLAGVPWFAGHTHGYPSALFGYLLGFAAATALMSFLAGRGRDRAVTSAVGLFVLGELAIYTVGVPWLAVATHHSLGWAVTNGLVPFLVWDIAKALVAGTLLPAAWRLVEHQER